MRSLERCRWSVVLAAWSLTITGLKWWPWYVKAFGLLGAVAVACYAKGRAHEYRGQAE